jgi:hypothetical protein
MKPASQVTACIVDYGVFVELAAKLSQTFKKTYYAPVWERGSPKMNQARIGEGMGNLEIVSSVFEHFDETDLFIFTDVGHGWLQNHLESLGKAVWGSRLAESLELNRALMKHLLGKLGLPVGPWQIDSGWDELLAHLKKSKDVHVKIDRYRGNFETFASPDFKTIESKLVEVAHDMGEFRYDTDFIVEDDLPDKVEVGTDAYTIDGKFPSRLLAGLEIKNRAYVGTVKDYAALPQPVILFNEKIAPTLAQFGYRGFFATEVRVGKDQQPYMIDACCRAPAPPNELFQELYLNLADIIWRGANGVLVDPEPKAQFGAQAMIVSTWADKNWQPIDFPEELKPNVKLRYATKIKGRYYAIPQDEQNDVVGAVVGWGDSLAAAQKMVEDVAAEVTGHSIEIATAAFAEAQGEIDKGKEYGVSIL